MDICISKEFLKDIIDKIYWESMSDHFGGEPLILDELRKLYNGANEQVDATDSIDKVQIFTRKK